ncbi:hypothetical protein EUA03_09400 [Mycolicibacterium mucogenicum]|uniref:Uncharacterized protein n=2 Tax=Mycolicibacterium mucogenicum TaxID=56689 RepID=A0A4R5WJI6_MYCMU|nr:hypothetical protein EUA03_09400 [Mycolicibacterium mucogenicum]
MLAIGVGAVVVLLVVIIGVVVFSNSTDDSKSTQPTAKTSTSATPLPGETPGVKSPIAPPPNAAPAPTPTPTTAVTPPPVLKAGDDCPDTTLAAKGITNQPTYVIGDQPKFTMVVTNIGLVECKRDVGAAVLAAYVYSLDNNRLWSNLDCAPSNETLVRGFKPGEQVTTEVTWTGMGSAPNCPLPRQAIGPGTYNLVVQLGNLRSAPVPFVLSEAQQPGAGAPPAGEAPPPPPVAPAPGEPTLPGPAN